MSNGTFGLLGAVLALALASTHACAQSAVTISGLWDVGVFRDTSGTWRAGPIQRSNIAFSGEEALGGGVSTTFALSHRFDSGTGENESPDKPFWHGEATLGFKGPFGAVKLGRRLDAIYDNDWNFDPWFNFDRIASPAWDTWHYLYPSDPHGDNGTPEYGRLDNGVFYDSPDIGGLTLHLSGSPETWKGDSNLPLAGALLYKGPTVEAMLAHGRNSASATETFAGLKVVAGRAALMGVRDVTRTGASRAVSTTLGATWDVGPVTLKAGWGRVAIDGATAERMTGLGAVWNLSKRTSLYVDAARKRLPAGPASTYGVGFAHGF